MIMILSFSFLMLIIISKGKMEEISCFWLEYWAKQVGNHEQMSPIFDYFSKKYNVCFKYQPLDTILSKAANINSRFNVSKEEKKQHFVSWRREEYFQKDQLHIFKWVLAVYCKIHSIDLDQMVQKYFMEKKLIFEDIGKIFPGKSLNFIRYETNCLIYQKRKIVKEWTEEQQNILQQIMKKFHQSQFSSDEKQKNQNINWSWVSYQLFQHSSCLCFRTLIQCKEKWLNHMSEDIKRSEWDNEEIICLLEGVNLYGRKWANICQSLKEERTQHMVKNKFHSVEKFWRKKTKAKKLSENWIEKAIQYFNKKIERKKKGLSSESESISPGSFSSSQKQSKDQSDKQKLEIVDEYSKIERYPSEERESIKMKTQNKEQKLFQKILSTPQMLDKMIDRKYSNQMSSENIFQSRDCKMSLEESVPFEIRNNSFDEEFGYGPFDSE